MSDSPRNGLKHKEPVSNGCANMSTRTPLAPSDPGDLPCKRSQINVELELEP